MHLRDSGQPVAVALTPQAQSLHQAARAVGLPTVDLRRSLARRGCVWHAQLHDTYDRVFAAAILARRAIGPTVVSEHLPHSNASDETLLPGRRHPLGRPVKTAFKRAELACADAVIAVSPSSARFLSDRYGIPPDRIDVIMNGLPPARTPPPPRSGNGMVRVVSVGTVIHQKGHDLLLEAATRSAGRWQATVIGDGPMREPLAQAASAKGLRVRFDGWSDDVGAALRLADVLCMPSRWEACPYTAIEAMNAGLPIVGADVDGLRDLIEHGRNGLLVPADDPRALAEALDLLAGDPARRHAMGQAAWESRRKYTVEQMGTATQSVYRRVLDGRSTGR